MIGPVSCHFTGPSRPAAASRKARRPPKASWSRSAAIGDQGVDPARIDQEVAVGGDRHAADADGGLGQHPLGRRPVRQAAGWPAARAARTSTKSAAARGSRCGRLPTPVVTPAGRPTSTPMPPLATPHPPGRRTREPGDAPRWSLGGALGKSCRPWRAGTRPCGCCGWPGSCSPSSSGPRSARPSRTGAARWHWSSQAGLWSCWAVGLVAVLVPSAVSLTVVRVLAPARHRGGRAGGRVRRRPDLHGAGLRRDVDRGAGRLLGRGRPGPVQGSAYGDERRFLLRPPAALLVGPLPLAWALMAGPLVTGTLLLGARAMGRRRGVRRGRRAARRAPRAPPAPAVAAHRGAGPGRLGGARSAAAGRHRHVPAAFGRGDLPRPRGHDRGRPHRPVPGQRGRGSPPAIPASSSSPAPCRTARGARSRCSRSSWRRAAPAAC